MTKTTALENALIVLIATNEHNSAPEYNEQVWTADLHDNGKTVRPNQVAALLSSLSKKGLIGRSGTGKDASCALTPSGQFLAGQLVPQPEPKEQAASKRQLKYDYPEGATKKEKYDIRRKARKAAKKA